MVLLVGCKVDQEKEVGLYRRELGEISTTLPSTQPTDALQGTLPEKFRGMLPGAGALPGALTLRQAMAMANRDNERLAMAGENYVQALIAKDRAFASFLPTITLGPSYRRAEDFNLPGGAPASLFPQETVDVPVTAKMNVFNGFGDVALSRAAGRSVVEQRQLLLDMQAGVLLEVAQTYYNVLKAEGAAAVLEHSVGVQEGRVRDVEQWVRQGLARELDLQQSRARVAGTRVDLTNARLAAKRGREALAVLIGAERVDRPLTDEAVVPAEEVRWARDESVEAMVGWAREHREDLIAADAAVGAARQRVDAAFAQYYPSVTVNLDTYAYRESFPSDSLATALVEAKAPLFAGGRIHADVRTAWSRFRQAVLARSLLLHQIREQVRVAQASLVASDRRFEDLGTESAAARRASEIADKAYDQGLVTNLDRLDAQDRALVAELEMTVEGFDRTMYYLDLLRMTGRLRGAVGVEKGEKGK